MSIASINFFSHPKAGRKILREKAAKNSASLLKKSTSLNEMKARSNFQALIDSNEYREQKQWENWILLTVDKQNIGLLSREAGLLVLLTLFQDLDSFFWP